MSEEKKINRKILYEKPSLILIQFGEKKCVCFKLPSWHTMYWVIQTTHKFPTSPWWNYEAVASMYEVTLWCYKCTGLLNLVSAVTVCHLPNTSSSSITYLPHEKHSEFKKLDIKLIGNVTWCSHAHVCVGLHYNKHQSYCGCHHLDWWLQLTNEN